MAIYFMMYVDDLIVIGNDIAFITQFMQALATRFLVKNLGDLNYFLGIKVLPISSSMLLTQHKYIHDLLTKTGMSGAKEYTTLMSSTQSLSLHDGSLLTNATQFRQVIGALQYLSLTRLDISYVVNKLARFMHSPSEIHWSVAKGVLRYLKFEIHHELFLN